MQELLKQVKTQLNTAKEIVEVLVKCAQNTSLNVRFMNWWEEFFLKHVPNNTQDDLKEYAERKLKLTNNQAVEFIIQCLMDQKDLEAAKKYQKSQKPKSEQ